MNMRFGVWKKLGRDSCRRIVRIKLHSVGVQEVTMDRRALNQQANTYSLSMERGMRIMN
jgi:hypothetical protein